MRTPLLELIFFILVCWLEYASTSPVALPQDLPRAEIIPGSLKWPSVLWYNHGQKTYEPQWQWKWWHSSYPGTKKNPTVDSSLQVTTENKFHGDKIPSQEQGRDQENNYSETGEIEMNSNYSPVIVESEHEPNLPEADESKSDVVLPATIEPVNEPKSSEKDESQSYLDLPEMKDPENDLESSFDRDWWATEANDLDHNGQFIDTVDSISIHGFDSPETAVESETDSDWFDLKKYEDGFESDEYSYFFETKDSEELSDSSLSESIDGNNCDWTTFHYCLKSWMHLGELDWPHKNEIDSNELDVFLDVESSELGPNSQSQEYDESKDNRYGQHSYKRVVKNLISFWNFVLSIMLQMLGI